ncbi:mitochondrial carrier protein [Fragilaria crotonensis]|nr:mitochondrial carrier protein [Fragilaria crotonensis]
MLNVPINFLALLLLICFVGFEQPTSLLVAFASELDDATEDVELVSSITRKASVTKKGAIAKPPMTMNRILIKAGKRGLGGGLPGALAGVIQVLTLMWVRTVINYQSRYGASFFQAVTTLMNDGGIPRFYRGLSFALVQAPLARFVSTAANDGVEVFWPVGNRPNRGDQDVDSVEGFRHLMRRVKAGKIGVLYQGATANALSAFVGHYPWFFTYNTLTKSQLIRTLIPSKLLRNAGTGLLASIVSDTCVNAIRVVKTTKQAMGSKHNASYGDTIRMILAADGWKGLFGRGLRTRILPTRCNP